jgi:hypothetical protein
MEFGEDGFYRSENLDPMIDHRSAEIFALLSQRAEAFVAFGHVLAQIDQSFKPLPDSRHCLTAHATALRRFPIATAIGKTIPENQEPKLSAIHDRPIFLSFVGATPVSVERTQGDRKHR